MGLRLLGLRCDRLALFHHPESRLSLPYGQDNLSLLCFLIVALTRHVVGAFSRITALGQPAQLQKLYVIVAYHAVLFHL